MFDYKAEDIMTKNVTCANPDMKINELDKLFIDQRITGAPVVDENGNLVGVVSKSDIVNYDHKKGMHASSMNDYYESTGLVSQQMTDDFIETEIPSLVDATVKDLMITDVLTGNLDDTIQHLAKTMCEKRIHRMVIAKGKKVVGIVSTLDILKVVGAMEYERSEIKEKLDSALKTIGDLSKKI